MSTIIEGIQPLWATQPFDVEKAKNDVSSSGNMFSDVFRAAVDNVKQTDAEKNQAEYLLATGQLDNPAVLSIASTQAQMSVELLVQLRNKAVDAYNELMRISL